MKYIKIILAALVLIANVTVWAQSVGNEKFAVKAHSNIGLGDALSLSSTLPDMSEKSSANDYGVDFGWTFWKKQNHSLELNVGAAYSLSDVKLGLTNMEYSYAASADADMDGESYIRYYELADLQQKTTVSRINIPLYLRYAYRCNKWLGIHVDLGVGFGFKVSSKLSSVAGEGYSYGVYPQYDNLKIEESYLNGFGHAIYTETMADAPLPRFFFL